MIARTVGSRPAEAGHYRTESSALPCAGRIRLQGSRVRAAVADRSAKDAGESFISVYATASLTADAEMSEALAKFELYARRVGSGCRQTDPACALAAVRFP